jgi:ADP-heptose:LPS heptosyltransferase
LYKWWKNQELLEDKVISIFPFAGYGTQNRRSPSLNYWNELVEKLIKLDYKVFHFGAPNEPDLTNGKYSKPYYEKLTHLPFFEMIKLALKTKLCIGTDSGSSWVIGAYGHPQINLLTNEPDTSKGLAPENYLNNNINLFQKGHCDNIIQEEIIQRIKEIL